MREHVYMTAQPTAIINIVTSLDFKHYLMDDIVTLGYASVGADVINGIFGLKKGALTMSDLDFIQRRFRRWCEYHGFRVHLKTDSKTGKVTSYDLTLLEPMAIGA
ncbi:hypothetical protein SAMN05421823_103490 [Catalinimonas alkaloidigena]|uniref:Uncharacterized protein n=1 Tax=Catalinimonas alkaloidigena TaxID=1075417 RepID=A0A1G9EIY5_9BACT|nr:hypothetical protein [Catalinimonas alkaloidigena]SDK76084.1 hypothetical protein SAMN05421823_103490 [Catalinimonas alkaloidigena]